MAEEEIVELIVNGVTILFVIGCMLCAYFL